MGPRYKPMDNSSTLAPVFQGDACTHRTSLVMGVDAGEDWAPPASTSQGLSQAHISSQAEYCCFASELKVKVPGPKVTKRGVRGSIKAFSKASRRRLLSACHRIRRDAIPVFVTLTYPGEYPASSRVWKRDLNVLAGRLYRASRGRLGLLWKLEPQERGAPHYHVFAYGVVNLRRFQQWLSLAWYEVVGSGDPRHLRAGTRVEVLRSHRGAMAYAAKYMTKLIEGGGWDEPGRYWGIINRDAIPWGEVLIADISTAFAHRLKRWLRRSTGYKHISSLGQTFWVDSPESWFLRLDEQIGLSP